MGHSGHFKIGIHESFDTLGPAWTPSSVGSHSDSAWSYRPKLTPTQTSFTPTSHTFLIAALRFQAIAPIQSLYGMNSMTASKVHGSTQN
jgi:hypothetical protein